MAINKFPTPGSDAAIKMGCSCAIFDNNHGKGFNYGGQEGCFYMSADCGLHGSPEAITKYQEREAHGLSSHSVASSSAIEGIISKTDGAWRRDRQFWNWAWDEAEEAIGNHGEDAAYMVEALCALAGFR